MSATSPSRFHPFFPTAGDSVLQHPLERLRHSVVQSSRDSPSASPSPSPRPLHLQHLCEAHTCTLSCTGRTSCPECIPTSCRVLITLRLLHLQRLHRQPHRLHWLHPPPTHPSLASLPVFRRTETIPAQAEDSIPTASFPTLPPFARATASPQYLPHQLPYQTLPKRHLCPAPLHYRRFVPHRTTKTSTLQSMTFIGASTPAPFPFPLHIHTRGLILRRGRYHGTARGYSL